MFKRLFAAATSLALFSIIALSIASASPNEQSATAQELPDLLTATLRDANQRDALTDELSNLLADLFIEYIIAPHTGETTPEVEERLDKDNQTAFQFLVAVLTDAKEEGILPDELSELVSDLLIDHLIVPDSGETSEQATSRLTGEPASRPVSSSVLDELPTDDPPLNFRIIGYSHNWIAVQWEVPRNLGITNYVLQRSIHNGNHFVSSISFRIEDEVTGGSSVAWSNFGGVEADTLYRYTLTLKDDEAISIITKSLEVRTHPLSGAPLSGDATLSDLELSGVDLDYGFSRHGYWYSASVPNSVTQTTVTPTLNDPNASYFVKVEGATDDDRVAPLKEGKNVIAVHVVAEDGIVSRIYTVAVTRGEKTGGICGRTPQVRDAILALLPGVSDCSTVGESDLSGITGKMTVTGHEDLTSLDAGDFQSLTGLSGIDLHDNAITSLPIGIFSGLSNLTTLDVSENDLTYLPSGIFSGLSDLETLKFNGNDLDTLPSSLFVGLESLDILWMHENPGSPFELYMELKPRPAGEVAVEVREGAPFEILVGLSAQDGTLPASTVVIDAGERSSGNIAVTAAGDGPVTVGLDSAEYRDYTNYFGLSATLGGTLDVLVPTSTTTSTTTPEVTPTPEVVTGELPTDDPPVNFRVTGYSHNVIGVAWEVPRNRGITNYVLQRADYDGEDFISSIHLRIEDETNGGASHGWSDGGEVQPDTLYRYSLYLKNALGTNIITKTVEVRTHPLSGSNLSSDATLSTLALSDVEFDLPFRSKLYRYDASVANSVTETTITTTLSDPGASYVVKVGGIIDGDGVIPLSVGKNIITVHVTAQDDTVNQVYTVVVTRAGQFSTDASLSSLGLSGVDFGAFDPQTTLYRANVPNGVSETTVVPTLGDSAASYVIKADGVEDSDGVVPLGVGETVISVEVTAEDGVTTLTYTVTVTRADSAPPETEVSTTTPVATSTPIVVTGELSTDDPPLNFRITGYGQNNVGVAWEVPRNRGITNFILTRYVHNGTAFVFDWNVDGDAGGGSGHGWANIALTPDTRYKYTVRLRNADNVIIIEKSLEVRTRSDTSTLTVSSDASLRSLSLSGVNFGTFSHRVSLYTASVANNVTQTTVSATTNDSGASYVVKLGGVVDSDGVIPLSQGKNIISVQVTAEDGVVSRTYTVTVTRAGPPSTDATLSALSLSGVGFGTFSSTDTSYTASVANSVSQTTVSATTNDSGASYVVKLGGVVDSDRMVSLSQGSNTITVEVTAEDGQTTQTYTVTVTRAAPSTDATLSALSLSGVSIGTFSSTDTSYTASVANSVSQTTVTATTNHSGASYVVKLGGVADSDRTVSLSEGSNTITVKVTAEDGQTTQTYTVTVTRAAPQTGELPTDDPPLNFRITGYGQNNVGVAWEVPRNRGITNFVLTRYVHNGTAFVFDWNVDGDSGGGSGHGWANIALTPDTLYKYTVYLRNASNSIVIQKSLEVRTLEEDDS